MKPEMFLPEDIAGKIISIETAVDRCKVWRQAGDAVVFTNGVFDIVHKGHISLLAKAASFGDRLIVGLNSDNSVRSLGKGSERPINKEYDRAVVLAAMQMVDAVIIFGEITPLQLLTALLPDVLVKGGDYEASITDSADKRYIVGSDLQRQRGKRTEVVSLVDGYSTTAIVKKLSNG